RGTGRAPAGDRTGTRSGRHRRDDPRPGVSRAAGPGRPSQAGWFKTRPAGYQRRVSTLHWIHARPPRRAGDLNVRLHGSPRTAPRRPLGAGPDLLAPDRGRLARDAPDPPLDAKRTDRGPDHRVLRGPDLDLRRRRRDPEPEQRLAPPRLRERFRDRLPRRDVAGGEARVRARDGPDHLALRRRRARRRAPGEGVW